MKTFKHIFSVAVLFAALTVPASAQFCGIFGIGCQPTTPPKIVTAQSNLIVPEFEKVNVITNTFRGPLIVPANDTYFATAETAQKVAQRFGAARVEERESIQNLGANYLYAEGPNKGLPASVRVLIFTKGSILKDNTGNVADVVQSEFEVNAGWVADYFRRMPEKQFPAYITLWGNPAVELHYLSLAEQYVWRLLVSVAPKDSGRIRLFRFDENGRPEEVPQERTTL
jgi:hypothetical protein